MLANNVRTVKTRYGEMSFFADDQFVGKSLEVYGEYSYLEVDLWRKFLRPDDTVIDVGANIGAHTLALADIVGKEGLVVAIEAQPEIAELLERNVNANGLDVDDRVKVWKCALGAAAGTARVSSLANLGFKNYGGVSLGTGDLEVKVCALDDICAGEAQGIGEVNFIKIDIEGMEVAALSGARRIITQSRPILYVEDHPEYRSGHDLHRTLHTLDYRAWTHQPRLFNPKNWSGNPIDVFERIASHNLLCIPTEKVEQYKHVTEGMTPVVSARPSYGKSEWVGIARLGGIGDNLIAASVLRPLKAMGYKIDMITQLPQAVVFENNPFIDKLSIQRDLPGDFNAWLSWFDLRSHEYEKFVNLSHTCEVSLGFLRNQCQYYWPSEARRKLTDHNYLEYVCDIAGVPYEFGPLFFPTAEERDHALATREKYCGKAPLIGWCVTGSRPDKVYPQSAHVVARLIKELGAHVALLGAPPPSNDLNFANQIVEDVKRTNSSLDGLHTAISPSRDEETWPIRRLLTYAATCDLVIGPDTGPSWSVAFEPVPKIILLSHNTPKNITKHWKQTIALHADQGETPCWSCHKLLDSTDDCIAERRRCGMKIPADADKAGAQCISSIPVELVMTAARFALGDRSLRERMVKNWISRFTIQDYQV